MTHVSVDIGVFAHNEAASIRNFITALSEQSIFRNEAVDLRAFILANGCTDDTVALARQCVSELPEDLSGRISVVAIAEGGKSRTWNTYTQDIARPNSELLIYTDADIGLPVKSAMDAMVGQMLSRPELEVYVSRPVKDITYYNLDLGLVAWLISQGAGTLDDPRKSIAGSLYVLRSRTARDIGLPIGLPVEDGFLRAMLLTKLLSEAEDIARIDGDPSVFHIYDSIRDVRGLIKHQTRLVLGGAINAAVFSLISRDAPTFDAAKAMLHHASKDEQWLSDVLKRELPRKPYGYVPFGFLSKRIEFLFGRRDRASLKKLLVLPLGVTLDAVAYAGSTIRLMRGGGAGYW